MTWVETVKQALAEAKKQRDVLNYHIEQMEKVVGEGAVRRRGRKRTEEVKEDAG